MSKPQRATIVFYNEDTQQIQFCTVPRTEVQNAITRQIERGSAMNVPLGAEDGTAAVITDEVLKQLGGVAILSQGIANPDLRTRFKFSTTNPMIWDSKPTLDRE